MTEFRRVGLSTGITLNVGFAGTENAPAIILLHGFPESHRTWREVAPRLEDSFRLIMPDQRGFAGSDMPQDVGEYKTDTLISDIFALADTLGLESFALVGHDWGGAIAWPAALRNDPRLTRLAIINAPHPLIFQKSLIEDQDQRAASQYINWFRTPGAEEAIEAMGFDAFFQKTFVGHVKTPSRAGVRWRPRLRRRHRGGRRPLRRDDPRHGTARHPHEWMTSLRRRVALSRPT